MSVLTSLYRSLTRHRLFAALNIGGLALGIAVFLVLFLFVRFETRFDRRLPGADQLYMIQERYTMPGYPDMDSPWTMGGQLDQMRGDYPDLVGTRFNNVGATVRQGSTATAEEFATVDANFFRLFRFPVVAGDPGATLRDPDGLVITEKTARKYFGDQSPIDRQLTLTVGEKTFIYRVGAVIADMPADISFPSEMFARLIRARFGGEMYDHWGSTSLATFLRLPGADATAAFQPRLDAFLDRHAYASQNITRGTYAQSLRPLVAHHLWDPADRAVVTTLGIVGVLTLLIAVVNYVNLATARAGLRAREVAVRKVLGGTRRALIRQFLIEAVATVALAALIGLSLAELALPFVNTVGGTTLAMTYRGVDGVVLPLLLLVLVVGLLAGLYPAFVLSGFRPAAVLASARAPGGGRAGARLRQGLVVIQFAIAIAFAIGTSVMIAQTAHLRSADLGFRRDGLVLVRSFVDYSLEPAQKRALRTAFAALPGVIAVGEGTNAPGDQNSTNFSGYNRVETPNRKPSVMWVTTGPGYFPVYGARLVAGRLFDTDHAADDRGRIPKELRATQAINAILNTSAVRELGFASPQDAIGKVVRCCDRDERIVGVVDDLRFRSPRDRVPPTIYYFTTAEMADSYAAIRYADADPQAMIDRVEAVWRRVAPAAPFNARSVEDNLYRAYYQQDAQRSRLFTMGAVLAIAIGCIGLYGLAAFDTARRVKEIGIRKTLGASTRDILVLLVGQFMRPVVLANLIAWPLAFVAMRRWLGGFDDRIALSPLFFLLASLVAVGIATATVVAQAWKVSRAEPARALRYA